MVKQADVDIDFADRNAILDHVWNVPAKVTKPTCRKHNSGVYVTDVPYDPIHNYASIDYDEAETRGYFKIDFLNNDVYRLIRDQAHYGELLKRDPPWHRLHDPIFVSKITQIKHYHKLIVSMNVNSIIKMSMLLGLIRPGKKHLQGRSWEDISKEIWVRPQDDSYMFRKSHAVAYAILVTLHMCLIDELESVDSLHEDN